MKKLQEPFIVPHEHKEIFISRMETVQRITELGDDPFNGIAIKDGLVPGHSVLTNIVVDEKRGGWIYYYIC